MSTQNLLSTTSTSNSAAATSASTYRVGEFVYFEDPTRPDAPYLIRKIDELNKGQNGVEARVVIFYRRRDVPFGLRRYADEATRQYDNYYEEEKKKPENFTNKGFIIANGETLKKDDAENSEDGVKMEINEGEDGKEVKNVENGDEKQPTELTETEELAIAEKRARARGGVRQIDYGTGGLPLGAEKLSDADRIRLRQRELFMSRQSEVLPATQIRGKCRVTLLGEFEESVDYLNNDDLFFYSLVFDKANSSILADKGAIRVGAKFQCSMEDEENGNTKKEVENGEKMTIDEDDDDEMNNVLKIDEEDDQVAETPAVETKEEVSDEKKERDVLVYHPNHNLSDRDIDQYLIIARSVGTFARALDSSSGSKHATLHVAAACASRDTTIFHAMGILHKADYDVGQAVKYLVPTANKEHYPLEVDECLGYHTEKLGGPAMCRDQMEEWSTPECNLFDEGLEKCGKDFNDIRADYLPWKSMRDIIEYYYLYKGSNRYGDRKKIKQVEADAKLKHVYIPMFNKTTPPVIGPYNATQSLTKSQHPCEDCKGTESPNWYAWGGKENMRLCHSCWHYWKRCGGLTVLHEGDYYDMHKKPIVQNATNGNDSKPPVLAPQQSRTSATATATVTTKPIGNQQQPNANPFKKQTINQIMVAAKVALSKGQITPEQWVQLQRNIGLANNPTDLTRAVAAPQIAPASTVKPAAPVPTPVVAKPASKPNIVFYTTICRKAVRRLFPKNVLNLKKLGRKPYSSIEPEAILKSIIFMDKDVLLNSAYYIAGSKKSKVNETEFFKGITHLQHTISAAAASNKRSATGNTHVGEPSAKIPKLNAPIPTSHPLPSSTLIRQSLEAVGNTLLASSQSDIPVIDLTGSTPEHRPVCNSVTPKQGISSTPLSDSRWIEMKQHGVRYLAGPKLKSNRRSIVNKTNLRRIRLNPFHDYPIFETYMSELMKYFHAPNRSSQLFMFYPNFRTLLKCT